MYAWKGGRSSFHKDFSSLRVFKKQLTSERKVADLIPNLLAEVFLGKTFHLPPCSKWSAWRLAWQLSNNQCLIYVGEREIWL